MTIHRIDHPRAQCPSSLVHSQAPSPHSTEPHRASSPIWQSFTPKACFQGSRSKPLASVPFPKLSLSPPTIPPSEWMSHRPEGTKTLHCPDGFHGLIIHTAAQPGPTPRVWPTLSSHEQCPVTTKMEPVKSLL